MLMYRKAKRAWVYSIILVFLVIYAELQVNQILVNIIISIAGFFHDLQEGKNTFFQNIPAHFEFF